MALAAVVLAAPLSGKANFPPEETNLDHQMAQTTKWGIIHVTKLRFVAVPLTSSSTEDPQTWVDFEWVDEYGKPSSTGSLWHLGADTSGGIWISTMPHFQAGRYYVVLLKTRDGRFELVEDAMSAIPIENVMPGQLSAWDTLQFSKHHNFVPVGATSAVSDAQLHEVVDGLGALETRVKGTGDTP